MLTVLSAIVLAVAAPACALSEPDCSAQSLASPNPDIRLEALRLLKSLAPVDERIPPLVLQIAHSPQCTQECRLSLGDYLGRAEAGGAAIADLSRLWAAVCVGSAQLACTRSSVPRHRIETDGARLELPDDCAAQPDIDSLHVAQFEARCVVSLLDSDQADLRSIASTFVIQAGADFFGVVRSWAIAAAQDPACERGCRAVLFELLAHSGHITGMAEPARLASMDRLRASLCPRALAEPACRGWTPAPLTASPVATAQPTAGFTGATPSAPEAAPSGFDHLKHPFFLGGVLLGSAAFTIGGYAMKDRDPEGRALTTMGGIPAGLALGGLLLYVLQLPRLTNDVAYTYRQIILILFVAIPLTIAGPFLGYLASATPGTARFAVAATEAGIVLAGATMWSIDF